MDAASSSNEGIEGEPSTEKEESTKSGWDNVKEAFVYEKGGGGTTTREVSEVFLMCFVGFLAGTIYGGIPASRHARNRYIQTSHATTYPSKLEATGHSYNAGHRGFIRYGYRWGWRVGLLAGSFHGVSTFLTVYRDKTDLWNYTAAAGVVGGLYRINLGLRGMAGGAITGVLLSGPVGLLMLGLQKLAGETILERNKRERKMKQDAFIEDKSINADVLEHMEQGIPKLSQDEPKTDSR